LLALSDQRADASNPTNYYYHADAGGNITAIISQKNEVVARYHYDPFGNLLSKSGPMADFNRMRFSSKEVHLQSGIYYYGLRYYEPNLQRWLNQDPIGEAGGINLYRFVRNAPLNRIDPIGLDDTARGMLLDELGETETQKKAKKWKQDFLDTAKNGLELLPQNDFSEAMLGESLSGDKVSGTERAAAGAGLAAGLLGKAKKCLTAGKDWWKARKAKKAAEEAIRKGRKAYEDAVRALGDRAKNLSDAGKSAEEIARDLHQARRDLGEQFKELTPPDLLQTITERNLEKYGDPLGPSIEWLRSQGKSWEDIIESAQRPGGKDLGF